MPIETQVKAPSSGKRATRHDVKQDEELKKLRDDFADLRRIVETQQQVIAQLQKSAGIKFFRPVFGAGRGGSKTGKIRPELLAIGILKDSPLWDLEREYLDEMRRAENAQYSDEDVEVPSG